MVCDLQRNLRQYTAPPVPEALRSGAFRIEPGQDGEQDEIIGFLSRAFPGRWRRAVETTFAHGGAPEDVLLLKDRAGRIQGFLSSWSNSSATLGPSVYWYPALGERFGGIGTLGIAEDARTRIGACAGGGRRQRTEGARRGRMRNRLDQIGRVYGRLGFYVWRS